jgi:CBS domain-containing membrane protein
MAAEGRRSPLATWLHAFVPAPLPVDAKERWRAVIGAAIGLGLAAILSRWLAGDTVGPWLVAPLGASAVLVFAVPASPLAQPWSVVGGNTVSAFIGIACANWIGDPSIAGAVAVSAAIGMMFLLRCLHPPGGAMALIAVLTHATSFGFALFPACVNSLLLTLAGIAYNSLTGRRYPHVQVPDKKGGDQSLGRFTAHDLDVVLARYNQVLDVSRDDLEKLLQLTEMEAYRRRLGDLRCADIMTRDVVTVEYQTSLQEAWAAMRRHGVKALPVVDSQHRIVGIVTRADFFRHANMDMPEGMGERLRDLLRRSNADKPQVVGQIMTAQVRVASEHRHVVELLPLFSEGGHHHIPIIGDNNRLVGIITESDFVRALYRAVEPGA